MFTQAFSQSLQTWASQLTAQLKKKQGAHYLSFPSTRKTDEKIQELVQTLSRLQTHKQASLQARISLEDLPALRLSLEGTQNPFLHAWHTVLSDEQLFLKTLNLIQDKAFLESYRVFLDDFQKKNPDFYRRHSAYMYELFLVAYLDNKISLEDISSAVEVRSALKALWHTVLFTNYPQRCKIFSSLAAGLKPKTPLLQHLLACALDPKLWKDYIPPSNSPKQYDIFLKILQAPLNDIVKNLDGIKRQWIPHRILLWTFFAYAQNLISEEKAHDVLSLIGGALKPLLQRLHPLPCQEETPLPTLSQKSLKKILDTIGDLRGHPLYNALQDLSLDPLAWQTFEATIQSEVFLNNYQKVLNDLQNNRLNFFATVLARHLPFIMLLAYLRGDLTPEIAALIFHVINTATSLELPITLGNTKAAVLFPWVVWQTAPQNFERAKKIFSPPPLFLNLLFHVSIKELSLSSDTPRDRFLKSLKFCSWFDLYGSEVFSFEKKCDLVAYVRDINLQTLSFNYRAFLQSLPRPGHNICSFRLYKDLDFNICSALILLAYLNQDLRLPEASALHHVLNHPASSHDKLSQQSSFFHLLYPFGLWCEEDTHKKTAEKSFYPYLVKGYQTAAFQYSKFLSYLDELHHPIDLYECCLKFSSDSSAQKVMTEETLMKLVNDYREETACSLYEPNLRKSQKDYETFCALIKEKRFFSLFINFPLKNLLQMTRRAYGNTEISVDIYNTIQLINAQANQDKLSLQNETTLFTFVYILALLSQNPYYKSILLTDLLSPQDEPEALKFFSYLENHPLPRVIGLNATASSAEESFSIDNVLGLKTIALPSFQELAPYCRRYLRQSDPPDDFIESFSRLSTTTTSSNSAIIASFWETIFFNPQSIDEYPELLSQILAGVDPKTQTMLDLKELLSKKELFSTFFSFATQKPAYQKFLEHAEKSDTQIFTSAYFRHLRAGSWKIEPMLVWVFAAYTQGKIPEARADYIVSQLFPSLKEAIETLKQTTLQRRPPDDFIENFNRLSTAAPSLDSTTPASLWEVIFFDPQSIDEHPELLSQILATADPKTQTMIDLKKLLSKKELFSTFFSSSTQKQAYQVFLKYSEKSNPKIFTEAYYERIHDGSWTDLSMLLWTFAAYTQGKIVEARADYIVSRLFPTLKGTIETLKWKNT